MKPVSQKKNAGGLTFGELLLIEVNVTGYLVQRNIAKHGEKYIASRRVLPCLVFGPFFDPPEIAAIYHKKVEITTSRFAKLDRLSESEFSPGKERAREKER